MVLIPSGLPATNQNFTVAAGAGTRTWAIGAILSATVTGPTIDNLLPLRIGGLDATAQTDLNLQQGTRLKLQVIANNPVLTLRVLPQPSSVQESPITAAMRLALPRQAGLPPLLANLNWLASQNPQQLPAGMRELATSAQQLLTQLSNPADLSKPAGLQKAVIDSGIFLESKLAAQSNSPLSLAGDLKAGFLRLQQLTSNQLAGQLQTPLTTGQKNQVLPELTNTRWLAAQPRERLPAPLQPLAQLSGQILNQLSNPRVSTANQQLLIQSSLYLEGKLQTLNLRTLKWQGNLATLLAKFQPLSRLLTTPTTSLFDTSQASTLNANRGTVSTGGGSTPEPAATSTSPTTTANNTAPAPPQRGSVVTAQTQVEASLPAIAALGSQIAHLRKQLEGALSRIQLHQLASLPASAEATDRVWIFELPIRYNNNTQLMHVRIESDESRRNGSPQQQQTWTANLAFELPELGTVHTRISLSGEQLSTIFWAPSETTTTRFQSALPELGERLETAGFQAPRLQALHGMPPSTRPHSAATDRRLIDLST